MPRPGSQRHDFASHHRQFPSPELDGRWDRTGRGRGYDNVYKIAQVHALRGDADQTLEWLERSLAKNPSRALFLLADSLLMRFRDDPRFVAFCKKLGLPPPSASEALGIDQIPARLTANG